MSHFKFYSAQLSEKTIQNLKPEHNEFIDYEVFREVYKQMVAAKK